MAKDYLLLPENQSADVSPHQHPVYCEPLLTGAPLMHSSHAKRKRSNAYTLTGTVVVICAMTVVPSNLISFYLNTTWYLSGLHDEQ